ncbi:BspA family leucine-rich repeat surface protein [Myroides odoratimimus]|uniref:MBG domain-containing protein n=1 Tax=Myroides odoratimimus TaxID=76832 RepID=UPI002097FA0F|nr:MBG domain-containing protein [Myroides odoratimimus]MCO7723764.1 BspA family leucine-rich repeat surface protein [Myroides odoratimimus]
MKKFLLLFFLIFSPMLFAQTSTEAFETESAGSTSFTDNGVTFNIISHTSTFNIVNYPATGWSGTVNDNQYIDNSNSVGPSSPSFSIKTTSNLFKVNRFWVYVADKFTNLNATGSLTITGKLSGATKFTQTKTNNFVTSLGSTNGYTLIDLTNLNGQNYSNIVIDELQLTLGGNYYYLGLDAFTWVKDSNIVTTDSQSFITTWEVPNDNGSIKLYTDTNKYKYNYNVSWENIDDSDKKSKPLPNFKGDCVISNLPKGKYKVMITGDFPYFNVAKDFEDPNAKQLLTVEQWGTQLWKSMHKTFQSASNLIHIGKDIPNLTQVTDMSRMFDFAISFNGDLSKWDVSKVTDMQYIFSGASSFNGDLSKWNVSSLKNMQSMFHAAVAFDGDLSQWNVSSATNMIQVFAYAMSFNRDLSRWNVSNVTDMQSMFLGASSFNRDLSKWNVSRVIGPYGMLSMLEYSGMSVYNYDATLKGWANLSTINSNMILGATGLKYCTANTERDKLIKEKGWKINGDIKLGSEYILKDKSVVYDGKAHKLELELPHSFRGTYEIVDSSNNVVSDAINAGIYTVRAISECDQSVLHTATLTITPAVLTVTATPQSKVYGAVDPKLDYTISGLVNNDKETDVLSGSLSREVGENVGNYAITQGDLKANGNYTLVFKGADLTIGKAPLTVTANPQSKVYGSVDPKFDYTVSGLQFIDKETAVLSGSLSRAVGEDVGTYAIAQGDLKANGNYALSFTGADLVITPAVLIVSATAQSKIYGAVDPKLDYAVSGLQFIDKETAVLSGSLNRIAGEDVGTYAITQGTLIANSNYVLSFTGADLVITPALLTVSATAQSKVYGDVDPALDYTVSGLVNNDKEIDVLSGSISRAVGEDVGTYAITQGTLIANSNYSLSFTGADLNIIPVVLTVTVNPQSKVYGAVDPSLSYTVSGLVNNDKETAVLSGSLSRAVGEDVGTYAITQGDLKANGNYALSFTGADLNIIPVVLTVTVNPQSKVYGAVDPSLSYTVSGLVNNDKETAVLSGSLSRAVGEDVGTYAIAQGDLKANGNYTVDFIGANLTIEKAPIIGMVLKGGTYVYDTKEKSVLLSSTLPIGTKVTYKNNKQTEAGEYEVTALIEGDNYIPLLLKTKLIINKAPQHIEFNALSPVLYDNLLQLQLIANSSVDLPINYTYMNVGTTVVATVTSTGLVKVLHPGSVVITAHQDGNNNYEPAQSVSQILIIKSDKAEINSLIINGREIGELSSNKLFMLHCDEIDKQVEVELVTSEGASVNIGNHFFIDTPKAGIYNREIVVKSHSGTITNRYILSIERPFNFEDIVIQKFDNTLLVNNNPLTNGGYRFMGYKWFKNGKLIGTEQVYSVGNHRDDLLDIDALYSLELTTDKGEIIHSCPAMIKYTHTNSIKLYPNPVVKNGVMEIALDYPESSLKNIIGSVYSLTGQFLFKVSLENKISEVILPNTLVEGVYLMIIKIEGQNKVFRFMVKP